MATKAKAKAKQQLLGLREKSLQPLDSKLSNQS